MPIVFPSNSTPLFSSLSQTPCLTSLSALLRLLNRDNNIPKACSPTAFLFPSGAAINSIFFVKAYSQSIFSIPAPTLAINLRFVAFFKNDLSIAKRLRMTIPSYLFIFCSISDLEEE